MRLPGPENDETEDLFALLNEVKVWYFSLGTVAKDYLLTSG